MSQEIINFNQEKYEVVNYKNENSQNIWQKYHKSHQSKEVCFFGLPQTWTTIEHGSKSPYNNKDTRFPPNNFIHKAKWLKFTMAQNESKIEARARDRVRACGILTKMRRGGLLKYEKSEGRTHLHVCHLSHERGKGPWRGGCTSKRGQLQS